MKILSYRAIAVAFALSVAGCQTPQQYQTLVGNFGQGVTTASTAIGAYYSTINGVARQSYLDQVVYAQEIALAQPVPAASKERIVAKTDKGPTALVNQISPAAIKARTDALQVINVFGQKLTSLVTSTAPTQIDTSTQALGTSVTQLASTITKITGNGGVAAADKTLNKYEGPIASLVGALGKMYADQKIDDAIKAAVDDGAPQVTTILDLIDADLDSAIEPYEKLESLEALSNRVYFYNLLSQKMSDEALAKAGVNKDTKQQNPVASSDVLSQMTTRQTWSGQIQTAASNYAQLLQTDPKQLTQGIRTALAALRKYADSDHKPDDLAALATAFQNFTATATSVATPILELSKAVNTK